MLIFRCLILLISLILIIYAIRIIITCEASVDTGKDRPDKNLRPK